jgi:hypothetical protein
MPRYEVGRINRSGLHLLDLTIPEPRTGGDRSQIVCDLFTTGPFDWTPIEQIEATPEAFGNPYAGAFNRCDACWAIAWAEIMKGAGA